MTSDGLSGRGVVEVAGEEARALLQRLITNDVEGLAPGAARYAALLTPQGKILADFFVVSAPTSEDPERVLLDCPAPLAADLARRLTLYRLRAKVAIADRSAALAAVPLGGEIAPGETGVIVYADPRSPALGFRAIGPRDALASLALPADTYRDRRIAAGVAEGGVDFAYGDAFPHEANMDRVAGVDFSKGCYVGQEVVSRMQHRATVRKRVTPFTFDGAAPAQGAEILAGDLPVGTVGSVAVGRGLGMVRLDRVADALAAGVPVTADGRPVSVATP
jgi:tRNA-modifying protein YgfZ